MTEEIANGTLVLVVGPSGAGKDTLLTMARGRLAGDCRFVFPRRIVTRGAGTGEDHDTLDEPSFAAANAAGQFFLEWQAHGLSYAIPASVRDDLAAGRTVAANVSRSMVSQAAATGARVRICLVTASPAVLARRLEARGREDTSTIAGRLGRETAPLPDELPVTEIDNNGSPEDAANRFIALLVRTQT